MNTVLCSMISLCETPRGLNQSCRLELTGTTFLLHHCVIHRSLAFFFSFFFFSLSLSSSLSFVRLSMSVTPLSSSVFLAFFLAFLSSFHSAVLCPVSRFFLSSFFVFLSARLSLFPFCLALFLAVFLSTFIPFHSLVIFFPVSYSRHSRWAVESHLSQKFSLFGKFYETQRYYVNRRLGIC